MKKYFFSVAAIFICITISSCKNTGQKKEKDVISNMDEFVKDHPGLSAGAGTFSITAPEGWIKKDTLIAGANLTTITSPIEGPEDNFKENVNVVTEAAKGYDYSTYAELNLQTIRNQMPDINVISQEDVQLDGLPAKAIIYTIQYGAYNLKNAVYLLVKNDMGYVVTCTSLSSKFNKFQPEFTACVKSFKINN